MATLALAAYLVYLLVAFGLRTALQVRATGSTGFKGISGDAGSVEWWAGVGFLTALAIGVAAPLLALNGIVQPLSPLNAGVVHGAGVALFAVGLMATFAAQVSMGSSWRIGVDEHERTELVTGGAFAIVRNPIFAAMMPTGLGLALMVPSWVALAGVIALALALELQVRVVEEPHLLKTQGPAYASYAAEVGRFLPGLGRLG